MSTQPTIRNFGRNVHFRPGRFHAPESEVELLDILRDNRKGTVRAVGSKHSWSAAIETRGALVDMRHFAEINISGRANQKYVTVGAGCRIRDLLDALNANDLTLPSVGLIAEQTVAGATATGTHGSGKHSLSHYVSAVRLACYNSSGEVPQIVDITEGPELRAARCSLGCLGIVVAVSFPCIPQYFIEEKMTAADTLDEMLALEDVSPLQQFYLVPHSWTYYSQERRVASQNKRSPVAPLYRIYWVTMIDVGLHVAIKLCASVIRSRGLTRVLFRHILPKCLIYRPVVDRSDRQLVMNHHFFRHLEIEIFVRRSNLESSLSFVIDVLSSADDPQHKLSTTTVDQLRVSGLYDSAASISGCFTHHYPICIRRIVPDDTLISMTSGGDQDWYAISFITYNEPRDDFFQLATFLAATMTRLFHARIHWGKWFPLKAGDVEVEYPDIELFRDVCRQFDPNRVFANDFVKEKVGLD